jgi:hypothetical protein
MATRVNAQRKREKKPAARRFDRAAGSVRFNAAVSGRCGR